MEPERRRRITRIVLLTLFVTGVLAFMIHLDSVFGPLLFALLAAYILNPVVNFLQRRWLPRPLAIGVLFLLFYAGLAAVLIITVPALGNQLRTLYQNTVGEASELPRIPEEIAGEASGDEPSPPPADGGEDEEEPLHPPAGYGTAEEAEEAGWLRLPYDRGWFRDTNGNGRFDEGYVRAIAHWLDDVRERRDPDATTRVVAQGLEEVRDYIANNRRDAALSAADTLIGALFTMFGILTAFILVPIYLFYFLMGLDGIWGWTVERLPGRHRDRIVLVLLRIDESVSAFFRGRLIVMVIKAIITTLALWIVGLPYALFLGVVTGVGSLIPIAGFLMGVLPAIAIALLDAGSPGLAILVAGIFVTIEILENYLLTPWILKDRVGLHPVTIVVAVFAAGALFGFVGMLLAVPIASIAKILFQEYVEPEIHALAAEER